MPLVLTDPVARVSPPTGLARLGVSLLDDERDLPFLHLTWFLSATILPAAAYLAWPGHFRWWLAAPYLAFYGYMLGPYILMLHNTSHRRLLVKKLDWLAFYIPVVLGPFFGETPYTYFAHHIGMHHPENNLPEDHSSTMRFQRDSAWHFARYFGRFVFLGIVEITGYFIKKKRPRFARMMMLGELSYLAVTIACFFYDWRVCLVIFVLPVSITRLAMMLGNWAQHAFIDEATPANNYRNSITCINSVYNKRCFNDGYHIGHHLKQTRHWTEMPVEFSQNEEKYLKEGAVVFHTLDFTAVWFFLMLKRYDVLAKHFVRIEGDTRDDAAIEALLRQRTRRIDVGALEMGTDAVAA